MNCPAQAVGLLAGPVKLALHLPTLKLTLLPWGPQDLHLKCISSLAPREALGFPSVLLKAGGCHSLLWQQPRL